MEDKFGYLGNKGTLHGSRARLQSTGTPLEEGETTRHVGTSVRGYRDFDAAGDVKADGYNMGRSQKHKPSSGSSGKWAGEELVVNRVATHGDITNEHDTTANEGIDATHWYTMGEEGSGYQSSGVEPGMWKEDMQARMGILCEFAFRGISRNTAHIEDLRRELRGIVEELGNWREGRKEGNGCVCVCGGGG